MFEFISATGWSFPKLDFHLAGTKFTNLFENKILIDNFKYVSVFDGKELSWDCNKFSTGDSICRTVDTVSKKVLEMQCNPSTVPVCQIKDVPGLFSRIATPIVTGVQNARQAFSEGSIGNAINQTKGFWNKVREWGGPGAQLAMLSLPFFIFWLTFKRAQHIEICPNPTVINNYIDMPAHTMSPEEIMQTTVQQLPASLNPKRFVTPEMSHQRVGELSGNLFQDTRLYGE